MMRHQTMKMHQTLVLHLTNNNRRFLKQLLSQISNSQAVEKERKAKNILLMAIPKDHMRRFHGMDDAKEI
ncbi:hypothetical protein Tco_0976347 [Tanacetum coccineum]|uniref:Uncharacterized protein n=1 Tax=Tanacetum coccineum TaxID=301880 RepID=A0ABQ5EGY8_9ASTR